MAKIQLIRIMPNPKKDPAPQTPLWLLEVYTYNGHLSPGRTTYYLEAKDKLTAQKESEFFLDDDHAGWRDYTLDPRV